MGKHQKLTKLLSIQIGLAAPTKVQTWAERTLPNGDKVGQVTNSQTVNYKTLRPERDGLFCERIFGPLKDYECSCGRKPITRDERYCPDCEIEFTTSRVRRYRLGYIRLVTPVAHLWYLKGIPSYLSLFLNKKRKEMEAIVYCTEMISLSDLTAKQLYHTNLSRQLSNSQMNVAFCPVVAQKFCWELQDDWNIFRFFIMAPAYSNDTTIPFYSNQANHSIYNMYADRPLTGAEALRTLLSAIDLAALDQQIARELFEMTEEMDSLELQSYLSPWQKRRLSLLQRLQKKKTRRLKLIRQFRRSHTRPEWIMLSVLPVLPPDLRPILQMENDQVAVSDLNKLYQKVLFRNNRLERHVNDTISFSKSDELHYAQRLLQESVDALIENGKGGSIPITAANGRPLKSLSDMLKGKKGRFRQNLLGKRVDYSGRSVIVVGPKLKFHECGLPREMAVELFQPFLIRTLLATKIVRTILGAKHLIQKQNPIIWYCLHNILRNHPILLNRAPTLHRLGIQAFQPKLVSGRAILLHPLVCPAFNADFDGDQMAVHVPLSFEARAESWKLVWSRNNLLSPATGQPIVLPSQDMVLGCYYVTTFNEKKRNVGELSLIRHFFKVNQLKNTNSFIQFQKNYLKPPTSWANNLDRNAESNIKQPMFFSNLNTVMQYYLYGKCEPHEMIWLEAPHNVETDISNLKLLEFRVNRFGQRFYLFADWLEVYSSQGNLQKRFIKTTVGRVLLNKAISKT
nr:RNA polymerase b'-subunit [Pedinophyceae sp. YPF-701]